MFVMKPVELMTLFKIECIPLPGPPEENTDPSPSITCNTVKAARVFLFYPGELKPRNDVVALASKSTSLSSPPTYPLLRGWNELPRLLTPSIFCLLAN